VIIHHIINDALLETGGAQQIVRHLHEGSLAKGLDSRVVALMGKQPKYPGSSYCSFEFSTPYGFKSFFRVLNYVRHHCSKDDIIHAHLFPVLLYVSLAIRICRFEGRVVCTEHSTSNRRRQSRVGRVIDRLVYSGYNTVYCISKGTCESLRTWMPSQQNKLKVIENGAALPLKAFTRRDATSRLTIVSVGRLHRSKNYDTVLRALSELKDVQFEYRIAGTGPEEANLRKLCHQLGLKQKVKFCGYIGNVFEFLRKADVFLIPSRWEGFGLAAVEAMNSGLPVIASDVTGLREIVNASDTCGILTSPDSPSEIADAIRDLKDPVKRERLGKSAFQRSLAFSKEKMIDRYIGEYYVKFSPRYK
jgi:glycosyltransferase involved in cell wall biosynthesis